MTKSYDKLNRLSSVASVAIDALPSVNSYSYSYNGANEPTRVTRAEGCFRNYQYDLLGQVTSGKRYWRDWISVAGRQSEYGLDEIGNRNGKTAGLRGFELAWSVRHAVRVGFRRLACKIHCLISHTLFRSVPLLVVLSACTPDPPPATHAASVSFPDVTKLAVFLSIRGMCLRESGRMAEAVEAFGAAKRLAPGVRRYGGMEARCRISGFAAKQ